MGRARLRPFISVRLTILNGSASLHEHAAGWSRHDHQAVRTRPNLRTLALADLRHHLAGLRGVLLHAKILLDRQDRIEKAGGDGVDGRADELDRWWISPRLRYRYGGVGNLRRSLRD